MHERPESQTKIIKGMYLLWKLGKKSDTYAHKYHFRFNLSLSFKINYGVIFLL